MQAARPAGDLRPAGRAPEPLHGDGGQYDEQLGFTHLGGFRAGKGDRQIVLHLLADRLPGRPAQPLWLGLPVGGAWQRGVAYGVMLALAMLSLTMSYAHNEIASC